MSQKIQFSYVFDLPRNMAPANAQLPVFPQRTSPSEQKKISIKTEGDWLKITVVGLVVLTLISLVTVAYQYHTNKIERLTSERENSTSHFLPITNAKEVARATQRIVPLEKSTSTTPNEVIPALPDAISPAIPESLASEKNPQKNPLADKTNVETGLKRESVKPVVIKKVPPPSLSAISKVEKALPPPTISVKEELPHFVIAQEKPKSTGIFKKPIENEKPNTDSGTTQKLF